MMTSENSKPTSSRRQSHEAAANRADEHPLQLQPESGFSFLWFEGISDEPSPKPQSGDGYLAGAAVEPHPRQPPVPASEITPLVLSSQPAALATSDVLSPYLSAPPPSKRDRPGLVDAVIEQLRQARLRRLRPH